MEAAEAYCDKWGIIFLDANVEGAAKILNEEVGVDLWKIGSGDILDFVMLDYLRGTEADYHFVGDEYYGEIEKAVMNRILRLTSE